MRTENPIRTQPTHTISYIWRSVIRAHDIMLRTPCNLLVYHADLWRMCGFPYFYRNVDANFKKGQSRQTIQKRLPGEVTSQGNFPSRTSKRESFGRSGYQLMYNFRWVFSFALSEAYLVTGRKLLHNCVLFNLWHNVPSAFSAVCLFLLNQGFCLCVWSRVRQFCFS